ncbi:YciI family protein [Bowmanella sp. Y26]|uniref:YciI family protein n=1 Tax=Bowmanella yangjiangensis TaxID=2811230 RepID=A0ABS3CPG7_9ALTE|nr:YciI family protein [Bowmanella yangjiangensis]MBN7818997.1 YciI family protein [Bowmanella yangjiangensis]MBT1063015.1 YciI family protein [Bowmanella yangjiangensis]
MKYVCLVYYDEQIIKDMTEQQWLDLNKECKSFGDGVRSSGHCIGGNALQMTDTASTVRIREGKLQLTDGPFAETKEQLAGFYLMEAADLDEAIKLASGIPPARLGSIEIRPIRELPV